MLARKVSFFDGSHRWVRYTANRQRRSFVSVVVSAASKVRGEPFSVTSVGTGWVPAPSFAAGERVGSFVDHGVVAVALAGPGSLHLSVLLAGRAGGCRRWSTSGETSRCSSSGSGPVGSTTRRTTERSTLVS